MQAQRKLSVKEAAALTGVSESLVYAWCREQRLAHYRVGREGKRGQLRIDPADLDAFVRTLLQPAPAAGGPERGGSP